MHLNLDILIYMAEYLDGDDFFNLQSTCKLLFLELAPQSTTPIRKMNKLALRIIEIMHSSNLTILTIWKHPGLQKSYLKLIRFIT